VDNFGIIDPRLRRKQLHRHLQIQTGQSHEGAGRYADSSAGHHPRSCQVNVIGRAGNEDLVLTSDAFIVTLKNCDAAGSEDLYQTGVLQRGEGDCSSMPQNFIGSGSGITG